MTSFVRYSGLIALVLTAVACSDSESSTPCSTTADCGAGSICASGSCVSDSLVCNATTACPGGLACCGGTCSESACCTTDTDCGGGYCANGSCKTGDRPACSNDDDCTTGVCIPELGFCAECATGTDCPAGFSCSPQFTCSAVSGCTQSQCLAAGQVCAPEQGKCRACVSTDECGSKVCNNGQCVDCQASNQCTGGRQCNTATGSCSVNAGGECGSDADCDGYICVQDGTKKLCKECFANFECPAGTTCGGDRRCVATDGDCNQDSDCGAPQGICVLGNCAASCVSTGCAGNDLCNPSTGRCVPFSQGAVALGDACDTHQQCLTNVCWPIDTSASTAIRRCGLACSTSTDCPSGFWCYELGDGGTCVKTDFPPPGGAYNVAAGGTCTEAFVSTTCTSGYCNGAADACYERCSASSDCGSGQVCELRRRVAVDRNQDGEVDTSELTFTALCDAPASGTLAVGALCTTNGAGPSETDHTKCVSGYCAQTPDTTKAPRCAGGCCTPSDCTPTTPICKPIDVWDGIRQGGAGDSEPYGFQKVCLAREFTGQKQLGETCNANTECASELCAQGASGTKRCTQVCCTNTDCAGFGWSSGCRPPFFDSPTSTGEESVADSQFEQLVRALGRRILPSSNNAVAFGVSPICFPK